MGCFTCLKFLLSLLIFILMLIGSTILGVFAWLHIYINALVTMDTMVTYLTYIMLGIAVTMIVTGIIGMCGIYQESQCLIGTYFFVTLIVLLSQLGLFSWAFLHETEISYDFKNQLQYNMGTYNFTSISSKEKFIDQLQYRLDCCGAGSVSDFEPSFHEARQPFLVPPSCCKETCYEPVKINAYENNAKIHEQPCWNLIFGHLRRNKILSIMSLIITGLLEMFTLIFTMLLCLTVRKLNYYKP